MNTTKKMVLVPENELKSRSHIGKVLSKQAEHQVKNQKESFSVLNELKELLESEVPSALKMRLFNTFISTYLEKKQDPAPLAKREQQDSEPEKAIKPIEPSISEERPKRKLISAKNSRVIMTKYMHRRPKRAPKPNRRYINDQFGTGVIVPIKWTTMKKF